jgi:uncharacterized protein YuzE
MTSRFALAQTTTDLASQQWRQSATTRAIVRYDRRADVLYIDLTARVSAATSSLDAEEIFVFRSYEDDKVVGFSVPHFRSYWRAHMDELINHLVSYVPEQRPYLSGALYIEETTLRAAQPVATAP